MARVSILVLVLILEEKAFRYPPLWVCLYYVEMYFLYAHFSESIYHEWMLDFVNGFSMSIDKILCLSSFFNVVYHVD